MTGDKIKNKAGFTLLELLVGIAIFTLTITTAIGLFITVIESQRKSVAIQNVQENGRFLMWYASKEIRMSTINNSEDGETNTLELTHPDHGNVSYSFTDTGEFLRGGEKLSSDEVYVTGKFLIDGKTSGDNEQPRVTVVIKVQTISTKKEEKAEINLQTTFSQWQF